MLKRRSHLPPLLEWAASPVARVLYRVRSRGSGRLPAGGAVIVANHLSYVDPLVIQLACGRPLRFAGLRGREIHGLVDWICRAAGAILISREDPEPGLQRAAEAAARGEWVCIFPEGEISRTGQLMKLRGEFAEIARRAGVPVIPAGIDGLWGSVFSFAGQKYLWKSPRLMPTPVFVAFGAPIPPERASPAEARRAILDLAAEAFDERPVLGRHLGREVVRALAKQPGRAAVVDRTAERRVVSSAQLLGASAVLARRLRATVPERRVGIVLPPGAGGLIANLAVLCAGKVPVNLNFTASREAVEASLRMGGVRTILSAEAMRAKLPNFPWPERTLDLRQEIAAAGGKRAIVPWLLCAWILPNQWLPGLLGLPRAGGDAEAALLFTSGSAGEPKGVLLSHRNVLANCAQISSLSILPETCSMLGCLPLFHSFGFTATLWYPLLRACGLVTVPSPLDTRKIIDTIRDEKVTVLIGAPTFLRPMLKKASPAELASLEIVVSGAEKLPDELYDAFMRVFQLEILQGYGLTEASPVANVNQHHPGRPSPRHGLQIGKKTGSVGRLMPGMTARIGHPETGRELPPSETGMIMLRGANVFSGYLDDDIETGLTLRNGWLATGDLGHFDEDGFMTVAGRLSRFSKIGGEMIPHGAIEQKLIEAFDIDQAEGPAVVVVGVPDPAKGEALVVLSIRDLAPEAVRERLGAAGLPNLWIPKAVVRLEKVPLLGTGKLDVKACREIAIAATAHAPARAEV
jgi:acyl-[acyl-carrier-protein]-phospholipid O-acyltransferase/long-chain-fatty-acid--[acyl-carrier-protein] ligase